MLPAAARSQLPPRLALSFVVVVFVVLALAVALLTPPWEGDDEPGHVSNVEHLAAGHLYRMNPNTRDATRDEEHQPPLYYGLLAAWQRLIFVRPFPVAPVRSDCPLILGVTNCPTYQHRLPTDGLDQRRVAALRIPGILFAALTVLFTGFAARMLSHDPWTPVVAAATVAFVPRFLRVSGVVNNDNLANTLAAIGTLVAVVVSVRAPSPRHRAWLVAALGFVLGGLILTKETALSLAPGLLLAAYFSGSSGRQGVKLAATVLGVAIVVSAPWLIYNTVSYGDPLAVSATHTYLKNLLPLCFTPVPASRLLFVTMPRALYQGLWYQAGPVPYVWPWWAYLPVWVLTAGALLGLAVPHRRKRATRAHDRTVSSLKPITVLGLLAVLPVIFVWLDGLETFCASPRYALVGLPAGACLIALGLERLRVPAIARFALPALGLVACLVALKRDVTQVYTSGRAPIATPVAASSVDTSVRFAVLDRR